jgi:hypothetical protein
VRWRGARTFDLRPFRLASPRAIAGIEQVQDYARFLAATRLLAEDVYADPVSGVTGDAEFRKRSVGECAGGSQNDDVYLEDSPKGTISPTIWDRQSTHAGNNSCRDRQCGGGIQRGKQHEKFITAHAKYRSSLLGTRLREIFGHDREYPISFDMPALIVDPNESVYVHQAARRPVRDDCVPQAVPMCAESCKRVCHTDPGVLQTMRATSCDGKPSASCVATFGSPLAGPP